MAFDRFIAGESKRFTYTYQLDYWSQDNPSAFYPRPSTSRSINGSNNDIERNPPSDYFLINAKYFRLKNLQIGYDLKHSVLANTPPWISSLRLVASGTNLFTISEMKDYFDPEQTGGSPGYIGYGYPVQRTYTFGVNLGF